MEERIRYEAISLAFEEEEENFKWMLLEKANQTVGDKVLAARINGVLQDMYHEYAPEKDVVVRALDLLAKYNEQPLLVAKGFIEIERTVRTEPQRERIERLMRSIECQTTLPLKR